MELRTIEVHQKVALEAKASHYLVRDVPAEVCRQCGETVYRKDVVEKLEAISRVVKKGKRPSKAISIPVYSLTDD